MKIKVSKLPLAISAINGATMAFFVYRFVWFGIETVPQARIDWLLCWAMFWGCALAIGLMIDNA